MESVCGDICLILCEKWSCPTTTTLYVPDSSHQAFTSHTKSISEWILPHSASINDDQSQWVKDLWALKIALNFMDTLATQCILSPFFLLFLFATWKMYSESKLFMLGMYRATCRHVICHFEDSTRTLCSLKAGWAVSASTVTVDWESVHFVQFFFFPEHQLCWHYQDVAIQT